MATATSKTSTRTTNSNDELKLRVTHVEKIIIKISPQIDEIYKVIVGNEAFQQEGLISRVKKLEDQNEKSNALRNKLMGAFIVGGAIWTVIWEVIKNNFLK
jgi:hypothetical protein